MAAAGASTGVPGTESGVQVDSSVAHQFAASIKAATSAYAGISIGVGDCRWSRDVSLSVVFGLD